jgi:hypothetical protein
MEGNIERKLWNMPQINRIITQFKPKLCYLGDLM